MNNKVCPTCGATILEGNCYCIECGTAVEQSDILTSAVEQSTVQNTPVQPVSEQQYAYGQPTYQQPTYNQASYGQEQSNQSSYQQYSYQSSNQPVTNTIPGEDSPYQPISTWGFVGIMLLMCVPCVGFVFLIVWACGGCRKVNKRNYARAALIITAISTLLSVVTWLIFGAVLGTVMEESGLSSLMESEYGEAGLDLDTLAAISNGDFSALEDYDYDEDYDYYDDEYYDDEYYGEYEDEYYEDEYDDEYEDEYYEDEYYEDEYYEDEYYEDDYSASDYDGWPADYLPAYPGGEGEYLTSTCTIFYDTTAEEMRSYIDTLKGKGFVFEDFFGYDIAEEDALEMNAWMGSDGYMYLIMFYEEGELMIDHSTELMDLDY